MNEFASVNRSFFKDFPAKGGDGGEAHGGAPKLLIEEPSLATITHKLGLFSLVLNQARGFTPRWIWSGRWQWDKELLQSYCSTAGYAYKKKLGTLARIKVVSVALFKFLLMKATGDILGFTYDRVLYGDMVYDSYLSQHKVATVPGANIGILKIMLQCMRRHENIKQILLSDNYEGVLISHRVGIRSGVLLRCALRYGKTGYLHIGYHRCTLQVFTKPKDVFIYECDTSSEDVDRVIAAFGDRFDEAYEEVYRAHISGVTNPDAIQAFAEEHALYESRDVFLRDFGLQRGRKNIFFMIHAMNDFPHSHFRWMLFRDYFVWLRETLEFAKTKTDVNWIFKQHPSVKFYKCKDVNWEELFSNLPPHIIYIGEDQQIDTRSLISCADTVLTCLGSAGFELPAMGGIPSVVASDNFYRDIGFAVEPKTKGEYFDMLRKVDTLEHLSSMQQKRARAAYMNIHLFCAKDLSACPKLSFAQQKDDAVQAAYFQTIAKLYSEKGEEILGQMRGFIADAADEAYRRTNSMEEYISQRRAAKAGQGKGETRERTVESFAP